jgi:hypothetical protein
MADEPYDDPSDADRQQVVDQLRRHMAEGRLDIEEFESRDGVAYSSEVPAGPAGWAATKPHVPSAERRPAGPRSGADLMSIPAFRVHLFLWLVFSAFWMVIWLGSVMATEGWVPFWPVFPIAAFGLSVGIHAAVRKGLSP